jgi:hypothetical protein
MGQIKGKGRNYTPWDLLIIGLEEFDKNYVKYLDTDKLKEEWNKMSPEEQKELILSTVELDTGQITDLGERFLKRMWKYIKGGIPKTIPAFMKNTVEKAHKYMTTPGLVLGDPEGAVEAAMDVASLSMLRGHGVPSGTLVSSGVPLSGSLKKSAGVLKHTMEDETLKKAAKNLGFGTEGVSDISSKMVKELGEQSGGKSVGFKRKLKNIALNILPISPEKMYRFEKSGIGSKIYRVMDLADQGMNRFMVDRVHKFLKATGGIKKGSESSRKVAQALENKLPKGETLTAQEDSLFKFLKKEFDFLINKYAQSVLKDDKKYRKLAGAASADKKPMVQKKDLTKTLTNDYNAVVGRMLMKFGKKNPKTFTKKEKSQHKNYLKELDKIKHKGWRKKQDKTDLEVFDLLSRKISNYLPHIFDQKELLKGLQAEKVVLEESLKLASGKELTKVKRRLVSVNSGISALKGGELVTYQQLPQRLRFKFFEPRKGALGYLEDSVGAYETYLRGISKKIYQDPAMIQVKSMYKGLSPEYRKYVTKHASDWLQIGRTGWDDLADWATSVEWMLKLGGNPRSAITNTAQRLNTVADVGIGHSMKGYAKGFTDEGKKLFAETGLAQEVPQVLMEGVVPQGLARYKEAVGYLFTKAELGNRKMAFLAGLSKGKALGLKGQELTQFGIDVVHKTQFRYGSIGMPAPMRTPGGKMGMQFWSYPVKQTEFLVEMMLENPWKVAKWALYAEGGREVLEDVAKVDLGNAMGLGFNWGELADAVKAVGRGEPESVSRHLRLANQGGGLVPGYSPLVSAVGGLTEGWSKGEFFKSLGKEAMPVQVGRMIEGAASVEDSYKTKSGRKFPVYDKAGRLVEPLNSWEFANQVFGARPAVLSDVSLEKSQDFEYKQLRRNVSNEAMNLLREGKDDEAEVLLESINADLTAEMEENAAYQREVPWRERREDELTDADELIREARP